MYTRSTLLKKINNQLHALASAMKSSTNSNSPDILERAINECCTLVNSIYNYELVPTSMLSGIDRIDPAHRIAIKVTPTATKQSIQDMVEVFRNFSQTEPIKTLIILIASTEPFPGIREGLGSNSAKLQILYFSDLYLTILDLPTEKLEQIESDLKKSLAANARQRKPHFPAPIHMDALSPACRQTLFFATLLSEEDGLHKTLFLHGLERNQDKAVKQLQSHNWLVEHDERLYLNEKLPDSAKQQAHASEEALSQYLDRLWYFEKSRRWDRLDQKEYAKIQLARIFANASAYLHDPENICAQRSAELWMDAQKYNEALFWEKQALQTLETNSVSDPFQATSMHEFMGKCHIKLRRYAEALQHWKYSLALAETCSGSGLDLAIAHYHLVLIHTAMSNFLDAHKHLEEEVRYLEPYATHSEFTRHPHLPPKDALHRNRAPGEPRFSSQALYSKLIYLFSHQKIFSPEETDSIVKNLLSTQQQRNDTLPRHRLPGVPPASAAFIAGSRDTELQKLRAFLNSDEPVFLWGFAGIGKTEIAIQLAQHYAPSGGAYYLRYCDNPRKGEAMRETILRAPFSNYLFQGRQSENRQKEYEERMRILREEYSGALLIIDNFNRTGKTIADLQAEKSYQELIATGVKLVIITRSHVTTGNNLYVNPLPTDILLKLMRQHISEADASDDVLCELIFAVDHHPLMVNLVACILEVRSGLLTPEQMLAALRSGHPQVQAPDPSIPGWEADRDQVHQRLHPIFELAGLEQPDRDFLGCAALLPDDGMHVTLFNAFLPYFDYARMQHLRRCNLLFCKADAGSSGGGIMTIHPVIRHYCMQEHFTTTDMYQHFLRRLWDYFRARRKYEPDMLRQIAGCLSMASEKLTEPAAEFAMMAGLCWNSLGLHHRALHYELRAVDIWENSTDSTETEVELVNIYNNIGNTYRSLGLHKKALRYMQMAVDILKRYPDHEPRLSKIYSNMSNTYHALGRYGNALNYAKKSLEIRREYLRKHRMADGPALATSHNNVGFAYMTSKNYEKAREHLETALELSLKELPPDHPSLAVSYSNVANIYSALDNPEKALEFQLSALDIHENNLPINHPDLATTYNNTGGIYTALGEHHNALEYKLKALAIRRKVLPWNHPDLATTYSNVSASYRALGDFESALEYLRQALTIREESLTKNHPALVDTYSTMGYIYMELKCYDDALKYLHQAVGILDDTPRKNAQFLASTYNRIGTIHIERKEYPQALEHFQKALAYAERLPDTNREIFATVCGNVGYMHLALEHYTEAKHHLERARDACNKIYSPTHPEVQELRNAIQQIKIHKNE